MIILADTSRSRQAIMIAAMWSVMIGFPCWACHDILTGRLTDYHAWQLPFLLILPLVFLPRAIAITGAFINHRPMLFIEDGLLIYIDRKVVAAPLSSVVDVRVDGTLIAIVTKDKTRRVTGWGMAGGAEAAAAGWQRWRSGGDASGD